MNMKKWIALMLAAMLLLTGCGKQDENETAPSQTDAVTEQAATAATEATTEPITEPTTEPAKRTVDVDLTGFSSTMVYSEVYNMLVAPQSYEGKTVRMAGTYSAFMDQNTGAIYHVCMIADASACCAQGVEFILSNENYPEMESDIIVSGTFRTYVENGTQYCHLVDAVLE